MPPLHDFRCERGHVTEEFVAQGVDEITCACLMPATKVFLTAPMAFVQPDICYDSPIDGRAITSKQARAEDLARSGCIPYDPEMKADHKRRLEAEEKALEDKFDRSIDEEISKMPAVKRERLQAELERGSDVSMERITPTNVAPLKVELPNG
jgi:hypothetical protein